MFSPEEAEPQIPEQMLTTNTIINGLVPKLFKLPTIVWNPGTAATTPPKPDAQQTVIRGMIACGIAPEKIFFKSCLRGSYNSHATTQPLQRAITALCFNTFNTTITTIIGSKHCHNGFSFSTLASTNCSLSISSPVGKNPSPFLLVRLHCHQIYREPIANVIMELKIPRTGADMVVVPKYCIGMMF